MYDFSNTECRLTWKLKYICVSFCSVKSIILLQFKVECCIFACDYVKHVHTIIILREHVYILMYVYKHIKYLHVGMNIVDLLTLRCSFSKCFVLCIMSILCYLIAKHIYMYAVLYTVRSEIFFIYIFFLVWYV